MNETLYDDGSIRVTPFEIKAKGFVLSAENVSSIKVNTIRPLNWMARFMVFPIVFAVVGYLVMQCVFGSWLGPYSVLAPLPIKVSIWPIILLVPPCIIVVLGLFLRLSRLFLRTAGGPVILASKVSLTYPYGTVQRYKRIKEAIKKAKSLSKQRRFQSA